MPVMGEKLLAVHDLNSSTACRCLWLCVFYYFRHFMLWKESGLAFCLPGRPSEEDVNAENMEYKVK